MKTTPVHDTDAARLLDAVRALVRRFSLSERADVACCGVTVAQSATLEALAGGPQRIGDLGRRLGISPSTLSRNLDRLEERGLVTRSADGGDARVFRVTLTAKGRHAAAAVRRDEEAFAREVLDRIPASARGSIVDQVERLLVAVRDATESCCPGAFAHLMKDFPTRQNPRARDGQ